MPEQTCRNCEHWTARPHDAGPTVGIVMGSLLPAPGHRWGGCRLADYDPKAPPSAYNPAFAFTDMRRPAELLTLPDFGCNRWTKRHQPTDT